MDVEHFHPPATRGLRILCIGAWALLQESKTRPTTACGGVLHGRQERVQTQDTACHECLRAHEQRKPEPAPVAYVAGHASSADSASAAAQVRARSVSCGVPSASASSSSARSWRSVSDGATSARACARTRGSKDVSASPVSAEKCTRASNESCTHDMACLMCGHLKQKPGSCSHNLSVWCLGEWKLMPASSDTAHASNRSRLGVEARLGTGRMGWGRE